MKKLIAILGVVSILTMSGCWLKDKDDDGEEMTDEEIEEILEDSAADEPDPVDAEFEAELNSYIEILSKEDSSVADCDSLTDSDLKDTCQQKFIYEEAVSSGNQDKCSELTDEYDQETCMAAIAQ